MGIAAAHRAFRRRDDARIGVRIGSPLDNPMIVRPAARACRTRSVISTVAEGFSPTTRSASVLLMTAFFAQVGAAGVIIFNDGVGPARQNPIYVLNQVDLHIPAVISSYAAGNELLQGVKSGQDVRVDFSTFGHLADRFLPQVIADTKGGDKNNVLVVGAHLDSRPEGPGINDDGSGTAMLLAQAEAIAKSKHAKNLRQKIRFGWWGAEENGLIGSNYYASHLSDAEVAKIDGMVDYDMLASQNYVRFLYDGDGSDNPGLRAGPAPG